MTPSSKSIVTLSIVTILCSVYCLFVVLKTQTQADHRDRFEWVFTDTGKKIFLGR